MEPATDIRPVAPPADSGERLPLAALLDAGKELVTDELHRRLRAAGYEEVRPGHGCVFRHISAEGSRLTELAERAGMTKQSLGEVVADLEQLGYVERAGDPDDRRAKIIRLTERGIAARSEAQRAFAEIEASWAGEYGAKRVASLRGLLEEIVLGTG